MAGLSVLVVLFVLVSGYIISKSLPQLKRTILRSNGQQLTLVSATAGLFVYGVIYFLLTSGEEKGDVEQALLVAQNHTIIKAAFLTFLAAIVIALFFKLPLLFYEGMLNDFWWKRKISGVVKKRLGDEKRKHAIALVNRLHWWSFRYVIWSSRKIISGNAAEELYFSSFFSGSSGLCMFVLDSKKCVIGLVTGMPDFAHPVNERHIRILPYFTGHLCGDHLQLHITTDYTDHIGDQLAEGPHREYNFDVILPSDSIKYVREFDIDFFKSHFVRKQCPCGHAVYNTGGVKKVQGESQFRGFRGK
jgi:hypothetical protein